MITVMAWEAIWIHSYRMHLHLIAFMMLAQRWVTCSHHIKSRSILLHILLRCKVHFNLIDLRRTKSTDFRAIHLVILSIHWVLFIATKNKSLKSILSLPSFVSCGIMKSKSAFIFKHSIINIPIVRENFLHSFGNMVIFLLSLALILEKALSHRIILLVYVVILLNLFISIILNIWLVWVFFFIIIQLICLLFVFFVHLFWKAILIILALGRRMICWNSSKCILIMNSHLLLHVVLFRCLLLALSIVFCWRDLYCTAFTVAEIRLVHISVRIGSIWMRVMHEVMWWPVMAHWAAKVRRRHTHDWRKLHWWYAMRTMDHAPSHSLLLFIISLLFRLLWNLGHMLKVQEAIKSISMSLSMHHSNRFFVYMTLTMYRAGSHQHLLLVFFHLLVVWQRVMMRMHVRVRMEVLNLFVLTLFELGVGIWHVLLRVLLICLLCILREASLELIWTWVTNDL